MQRKREPAFSTCFTSSFPHPSFRSRQRRRSSSSPPLPSSSLLPAWRLLLGKQSTTSTTAFNRRFFRPRFRPRTVASGTEEEEDEEGPRLPLGAPLARVNSVNLHVSKADILSLLLCRPSAIFTASFFIFFPAQTQAPKAGKSQESLWKKNPKRPKKLGGGINCTVATHQR